MWRESAGHTKNDQKRCCKMGSGLRLLVALIALSAVSAVRVEHVTRAVTIEEIVTPIYNALAASGADDIPSEEELTEWLGETMKYYTEEEKQSFVAALNEGTISAEEWKEAWEAAKSKGQEEADKEENEVARRLDPDSLSSKKHLSTPTVARPKCSPKKLLKLVRKICKKNWRCWAIWFLVDSIAELLDQLNDEPEGGGCGDPHMYGFDGSSFLFVGDLDHAFNVLSDKSIEVHTRLVAAGPKKQTYFGSFDVSSGSAHVIVHAAKSDGIMAGEDLAHGLFIYLSLFENNMPLICLPSLFLSPFFFTCM